MRRSPSFFGRFFQMFIVVFKEPLVLFLCIASSSSLITMKQRGRRLVVIGMLNKER